MRVFGYDKHYEEVSDEEPELIEVTHPEFVGTAKELRAVADMLITAADQLDERGDDFSSLSMHRHEPERTLGCEDICVANPARFYFHITEAEEIDLLFLAQHFAAEMKEDIATWLHEQGEGSYTLTLQPDSYHGIHLDNDAGNEKEWVHAGFCINYEFAPEGFSMSHEELAKTILTELRSADNWPSWGPDTAWINGSGTTISMADS